MNIFLIIVSVIIILLLIAINDKLGSLDGSTGKIMDMAEMSDQQRYEYSLKIDDSVGYDAYLESKYYREEAKKKKEENNK